jgi:hypothetical protein
MYFRTSGKLALVLFLTVGAGAVPVRAESAERARKSFSSLINVDALIDNYLRFVARKYNLTEEQDAFTEQLVRARVDEFLNRHYDELADLVDKLVTVRNGGEVAPDELIDWGRRIQPIYQEAKGIIVQTNEEWRGILNDEQRQMHDEDVKLMWDSFATTEDQLSRLTAGQMSVDEFRNPRRGREARAATVTPPGTTATPTARLGPAARELRTTPDADQVGAQKSKRGGSAGGNGLGRPTTRPSASGTTPAPADNPGAAGRRSTRQRGAGASSGSSAESQWEQYVRQFIERYKLNEEQANRANKILKSCQDLADRYRRGRAEQLEKLDRQEAALRTSDSPTKAKEQAEITAQRAKLLAPIDEIFEKQLKPRLEKIPTRAQRDAAGKGGPTDKADKATPARPSGSKGATAAGTPQPGPKQGQDHTTIKPKDQPEEPPDNDQGDDEDQGDEDR